jgi:hypothetical protein
MVEFDHHNPSGRPRRVYTKEELTFRGVTFGNMSRRQDAELAYNEVQKRNANEARAAELALNPPPIVLNEDGTVKRGRGRPRKDPNAPVVAKVVKEPVLVNGVKRGRGRPRKVVV